MLVNPAPLFPAPTFPAPKFWLEWGRNGKKKSCHTGHNFSGPQKKVTDGFGETIPPEGRIQNDDTKS
jgi:hypothetical protein